MEKWDGFVSSLSGISSVTGNCVVVTTRSRGVASIVSTLDVHELGGLSTDNCWSIIKAKTLRPRDNYLVDEYEAMGKNIAERCQGLPLAAKVVGGLLFNKSRDEWISFEKNCISNFGDVSPISKILKLSFDNLSVPSLKKCFAYCSIFPKGYGIKKEKLIEIWMGEGFFQTDQNQNNMESTGTQFFDILLQQSLLQVARRHHIYGYVTHCNMHDLVHDLARSILLGKNDNVTDETIQVRYISYNSGGEIESLSNPKEEARYVRTLFFDGNVFDITFSNFKSLHTLILLGREISTLPISIKELIHLRYLDTSKTRIKYFPEEVGELYHLETLRAKRNKKKRSYLEKLPDSLKYLINVRHLHIPKNTRLPPHIGRMTSLQTLSHFRVGEEKGYGISELGSLKNLKGKFVIHNLGKVRDKNEAMSADVFGKSELLRLGFYWGRNRSNREYDEANDQESVLEGLQPHPNLQSLTIGGFNGKRFPSWTLMIEVGNDRGLNNLVKIKLGNCRLVEELPMLGHLPHLKALTLSALENVRRIGSSFYGINNRNSNKEDTVLVFRALERLMLKNMSNLIEWTEVEFPSSEGDSKNQPCYKVVVFPRLEQLSVFRCRKLKSAPSNFQCLKHLLIYVMDSGLPLENICGVKLTTLQSLKIRKIEGVKHLPDGLFTNNHNISQLCISDCLNLRELPDGLHTLNYLDKLAIDECPNLKSIGAYESQMKGFSSLRRLVISNCKGLNTFLIEILETCSASLISLLLQGLFISPMNGHILMECLLKMPRLYTLGLGPASASDDPCSWDDNVSFNEFVDAIFQTSKLSLCKLVLFGMSHWKHLPNQIHHHHLTSLSTSELIGFGMEALPEWFGNLSSLFSVKVINCKMLRYLPSKGAMQCLTKLTMLRIVNFPLLLKERSNKDEVPQMVNSEWTKISHIPHITVDGRPIN